jgi:hypothetical protein
MGRKKKYNVDELRQMQKKWKLAWYYRNREKLNKKRMEKYYRIKI